MKLTDQALSELISQLQADYDLMISEGAAMEDPHGEQFLHLTDQLHKIWHAIHSLHSLRDLRFKNAVQRDCHIFSAADVSSFSFKQ